MGTGVLKRIAALWLSAVLATAAMTVRADEPGQVCVAWGPAPVPIGAPVAAPVVTTMAESAGFSPAPAAAPAPSFAATPQAQPALLSAPGAATAAERPIIPAISAAAAMPVVALAAGTVMPAAYYGMDESPRGPALLRQVMLDQHNDERAAMGLPPLEWDEALAADAGHHADELARTGLFAHSPKASRAVPASGENMWMGPRRLYDYRVMVGSFAEEKARFRVGAKLPDFSTTGRWQDVGHYSQMIWRGTKKLGCALGDGPNFEYLVCRYFPAGNAYGKGPLDVEDEGMAAPASRSPAADGEGGVAPSAPLPVSPPAQPAVAPVAARMTSPLVAASGS